MSFTVAPIGWVTSASTPSTARPCSTSSRTWRSSRRAGRYTSRRGRTSSWPTTT